MKGFTLIELLVVVLIVGILSAIALPQYQKSIELSRSAEALTTGKTIIEAQNRALDAYGTVEGNRRDLDVALTGGAWSNGGTTYTTKDFIYALSPTGVSATRTNGAFTITFANKEHGGNITCTGTGTGSICSAMGME